MCFWPIWKPLTDRWLGLVGKLKALDCHVRQKNRYWKSGLWQEMQCFWAGRTCFSVGLAQV